MATGIRSLSLPSLLNKYNHEALMEDQKANIIAVSSVAGSVILIIIARLTLNLSKPFFLITGAGIALILAILIWVSIRWRYNRRRKVLETQLVSEGRELKIEYSFLRKVAGVPTKFRFNELEEATDSFRTILGQGSSGCVFKGVLIDGTCVAVKRIEGEEHGEKEFKAEVAAIASVQHVNLVRLLGYCFSTGGPRFLVYEFIPNGSLDSWIFQRSSSRRRPGGCLSWDLRFKVAVGVARALSYLHHDCRSRILHLDMKPENILLDEAFRAIVGDFGLSRLMGKDESRVVTTIRGTKGYLAPEWLLQNGISEKCDVYSYGMVLLEIIGGRRNVTLIENGKDKSKNKWQYFPKIVNQKVREGKVMEVVDPRLMIEGGIEEREVVKLVHVALWCIQERTSLRPSMNRVVEMLEGRTGVDEPPDTQMVVVDVLNIDEDDIDEDEVDGQNQNQNVNVVAARAVQVGGSDHPTASNCSYAISVLSGR